MVFHGLISWDGCHFLNKMWFRETNELLPLRCPIPTVPLPPASRGRSLPPLPPPLAPPTDTASKVLPNFPPRLFLLPPPVPPLHLLAPAGDPGSLPALPPSTTRSLSLSPPPPHLPGIETHTPSNLAMRSLLTRPCISFL